MDDANVFATTMGAVQIGGGDVSIGGWASTVYVEGDLAVGGGDIQAVDTQVMANLFATTTATVNVGDGNVNLGASGSLVTCDGSLEVYQGLNVWGGRSQIYGQVQIGSWEVDELTFHSGYWEAYNPVTFKVPSGYTDAFTFADSEGNNLLRLGSSNDIRQVQIGSWAEDELTFHSGYWEAYNPVTFKVPSGYTEAFTFADSDGNDLLRLGSAYGIQSIIADADVQINGDLFVSGEIHDSRRRLEDEKKAAELDELRTTVKDLRAELHVAMAALRAHGLIAES